MKKAVITLLYGVLFILMYLALSGNIGQAGKNNPIFDPVDVPVQSPIGVSVAQSIEAISKPVTNVNFAVVGDFGDPSPSPADYVVSLVNSWAVDAVVTTGDNNYPTGAYEGFDTNTYAHYGKFIDQHIFFPTLGNHDWGYPDSNSYTAENLPSSQYFTYLPGNRRYYSAILGNGLVKIIVLSTDRREPDFHLQEQWLYGELQGNEIYKFVFTHEPPYSSCQGKDAPGTRYQYKNWGVTAVFSGHCHLYERLEVDGLTYIVNGAGGGGQVDQIVSPLSLSRFQSRSRGASLIEATATHVTISFIDTNRTVIDSITIDAGSQQGQ